MNLDADRAFWCLLRDTKHDLAELLARFEAFVSLCSFCERENAVDMHPGAPAPDQLVRALEIRGHPHRRPVDDELLPPDPVEASRWAVPAGRSADDNSPFRARRRKRALPCRLSYGLYDDVGAVASGRLANRLD